MSGWIKIEKAVVTDVRFRRLVKEVEKLCNAGALPSQMTVTLVLGALVKLWLHADEHIREDNTLRASLEDIDEIMGIPGIGKIMPPDWLQVLDPHNVQLPEWLEHNGTLAKKRALTQQRVAKHRMEARGNAPALPSPAHGNALALPDQTRPDHTREDPEGVRAKPLTRAPAERSASNANGNGHALPAPVPLFADLPAALQPSKSEVDIAGQVALVRGLYPEGGREDWIAAEHHLRRLIGAGFTWSDAQDAVIRYAKHCRATGNNVMNPAKFFSAIDQPWRQPWSIPKRERVQPQHRPAKSTAELEAEEAQRHANAEH